MALYELLTLFAFPHLSAVQRQLVTCALLAIVAASAVLACRRRLRRLTHSADAMAEELYNLRTLIDNVPDYIYIKDTESRFLVVNMGWRKSWA